MVRKLLADTRGEAISNTLGFAVTSFVVFFVFFMNVQLGQIFFRRDAVDHAGAVAADTAKKTFCAKEENRAATERAAVLAVKDLLETAGGADACTVAVTPRGTLEDPGSRRLEVTVQCAFPCKIPVAAQVMCRGGIARIQTKIDTVSMGCDGRGDG